VAKTAAIAAVLPISGAAVLIARQVGGASAVEAAPAHYREPVRSCFVGAIAGRIDACRINLHWNIDDRIRLEVLGWVLITFAAAVSVVLLLLDVELGDNALELREAGGVRRAVGQAFVAKTFCQTTINTKDESETRAPEGRTEVYAK
jgi:hypothetical protein